MSKTQREWLSPRNIKFLKIGDGYVIAAKQPQDIGVYNIYGSLTVNLARQETYTINRNEVQVPI